MQRLSEQFQTRSLRPVDLIRWAEGYGVKLDQSRISKHLSGAKIGPAWGLIYKLFFEQYDRRTADKAGQ
jgi:hypothetical protein